MDKTASYRAIRRFSAEKYGVLFIPAGVAIIEQFDLLKECLFPFLLICFVTTIITFAATAYTVKAVMAVQKKAREGRRDE